MIHHIMMSLGSVTMRLHILSSCIWVVIHQGKSDQRFTLYRQLVMESCKFREGSKNFLSSEITTHLSCVLYAITFGPFYSLYTFKYNAKTLNPRYIGISLPI